MHPGSPFARGRTNTRLPSFVRADGSGTLLSVKVQPRAPRNEVVGEFGSELKVKVTAPPVDAAANETLVRFLAESLDCAPSQVVLVRGHKARHKLVRIIGISPETVAQKLAIGAEKPSGPGRGIS